MGLDRWAITAMIDLRHDENPSEIACLCAELSASERPWREARGHESPADTTWVPEVQWNYEAMKKRTVDSTSCFVMHSFAAALRWPRCRTFRPSKLLPAPADGFPGSRPHRSLRLAV